MKAWDILDIFEKMLMNKYMVECEYLASTKEVTIRHFFDEVDDMARLKFVQAVAWTVNSFVLDIDDQGENLIIKL